MRAKARERGIAFDTHVDLTYRCNEQCIPCYLEHEGVGELTTQEVRDLLAKLAAHGTFFLTLSGGEPFLRPDLLDIVQCARRLNFSIRLKTNATLIGRREAASLRASNVERVQVSIYSHRHEMHDQVTGVDGSFTKTLSGIRHLIECGIRVSLSYLFMRNTAGDFEGVSRLAADLGLSVQVDPTITPKLNGDGKALVLNPSAEDLAALMRSFIVASPDQPSVLGHESFLDSRLCDAGHTHAYIAPNGDIWPCVQFPMSVGNVREKSFDEIWRNSESLERVRALRFKDLPICSVCIHGRTCSRCPGLAFLQGDLLAPSALDCTKAYVSARLVNITGWNGSPAALN